MSSDPIRATATSGVGQCKSQDMAMIAVASACSQILCVGSRSCQSLLLFRGNWHLPLPHDTYMMTQQYNTKHQVGFTGSMAEPTAPIATCNAAKQLRAPKRHLHTFAWL
jgi:hypothetical protein